MDKIIDHRHSLQSGFTAISLLIFILVLLGVFIGLDYGYVYYLGECGDAPITACLSDSTTDSPQSNSEAVQTQPPITATGSFTAKDYSVLLTIVFPPDGGEVTGSVVGDCTGTVTGTYAGGDNGLITGKVFGSCSPFLIPVPARATFSGNLNQSQHTIPITGSGSAAGFSGNGSLTLTY